MRKTSSGHTLLIDGRPTWLNGACAWDRLPELKAAGGNSIRTWGGTNDPSIYMQAEEHGLTILAGVPFCVSGGVEEAIAQTSSYISMCKDAKPIWAWSIGNEIENWIKDKEPPKEYWATIERMAKIAKELDPDRLVMTIVSEISPRKAAMLNRLCPSLDIIGINSYASVKSLGERVSSFLSRPFIVTEMGPPGPWERFKTMWKAHVEPTSSEAAAHYAEAYNNLVTRWRSRCLGCYVFLWGTYQESITKPNWGEMFLPTGEPLGAVDAMTRAWTGKMPKWPAPVVEWIHSDVGTKPVKGGMSFKASVELSGSVPKRTRWEIRPDYGVPDWAPTESAVVPECIKKEGRLTVEFVSPKRDGAYRLFFYAFSEADRAAIATVPFVVKT